MVTTRVAKEIKPPEPPPEAAQPGAVVWLRKNLFSSPTNSAITILLGVALYFALRGALGFLLEDGRLWGVIPPNATNYSVNTYPRSDLGRIWASLYVAMGLIGLSLAAWRPATRVRLSSLVAGVRAVGVTAVVVGFLAPISFLPGTWLMIGGAVLAGVAILADLVAGDAIDRVLFPPLVMWAAGAIGFLVAVWLLPVASTTTIPWTIAIGIAAVGALVGFRLVTAIGQTKTRRLLVGLWLLAIPVIWMHIQRNPQIPVSRVTEWLPWIVGVAALGFVLLPVVSASDRDRAGVINAILVIASLGVWALDTPMVFRVLLLLMTALSLATPTFASGEGGRRRILILWSAVLAVILYLFVIGVASPGLDTRNDYYGGLNLTFMFAIVALLASFPLGVLLALGRTSTMPIFRLLSTGYIEVVRGVPLITVLFFSRFVIPNFLPAEVDIDPVAAALAGLTLFSAAYLAENVRGGLQSIPKGQYEAAKALGMTTAQLTMLITLPQALRAVIPAIVGQVISLFKDTSLVAIIGLAEFFRVANNIVPAQPDSLNSKIENLVFAAVVYWVFTYTFSRASQRLERRLGVGTH